MNTITITVGIEKDRDGLTVQNQANRRAMAEANVLDIPGIGGFTVTEGMGAWKSLRGDIIRERCLVYTFHVEHSSASTTLALAQALGGAFNQHSVMVSVTRSDSYSAFEYVIEQEASSV